MLPKKNVRSARPGGAESGRPRRPMSRQEYDGLPEMSASVEEVRPQTAILSRAQRPGEETAYVSPPVVRSRPQTLLAVPVGACIALAIHFLVPKREVVPLTHYYPLILSVMLGLGVLGAALHPFFAGLRKWMRQMCPILGVATVTAAVWELATSCFGLLPLPYFPGPEGVFGSLVSDRSLLFDSTWHSLVLLISGYALGVAIALITGVTIGWFAHARYWGMPLLKIVGPIPATAWIPLAMVLSPSALFSAIGLIALAVWFPLRRLPASGLNTTPAPFFVVAPTPGPGKPILFFVAPFPLPCPTTLFGLSLGS